MELLTSEELLSTVTKWMEATEKKLAEQDFDAQEKASIREAIDTCAALMALFHKNKFFFTQSVCVLGMQSLMGGPKHIEWVSETLAGLLAGEYTLVATKNITALLGPVGGRA